VILPKYSQSVAVIDLALFGKNFLD